MKLDRPFNVRLTVNAEARALAFVLSILQPLPYHTQQRILRAVLAALGVSL